MLSNDEWDTIKEMESDLEVLEWLYRHGRGPGNAAEELKEWKSRIVAEKEELKEKIGDIIKSKKTVVTPTEVYKPKSKFGSWTPKR